MKKTISSLTLALAMAITLGSCSGAPEVKKAAFDEFPEIAVNPDEIEPLGAFDEKGVYSSEYFGFSVDFSEFAGAAFNDNQALMETNKGYYDSDSEWESYISDMNENKMLPILNVSGEKITVECYALFSDTSDVTEDYFSDEKLNANMVDFAAAALNKASIEGYAGNNAEGELLDGFADGNFGYLYRAKITSDTYSPIWVYNGIYVTDYGAVGFDAVAYNDDSRISLENALKGLSFLD